MLALTRAVPQTIADCELTHMTRVPIDRAVAEAQHAEYEAVLVELGCRVERVAPAPGLPDSVFIEDTAIVLDEVAVMMRPGAASRRAELPAVAAALAKYRSLRSIEPPGTMDGGDVLQVGRRMFVGLSSRTNVEAVRQLESIVRPFGYAVESVAVDGCLHLKSAVTAATHTLLVLTPSAIDARLFDGLDWLRVHPDEPSGANVLRVGDTCVGPASAPRTMRALEARGVRVRTTVASELAKAEGALTCCSLLFAERPTGS